MAARGPRRSPAHRTRTGPERFRTGNPSSCQRTFRVGSGIGTTAICNALNLDGKTVRRYKLAATADELLTEPNRAARELDEHATYLVER